VRVRGVIISAGESSRFGSPKALLEYQDRTVLERVSFALSSGGCDELLVVCGGTHQELIETESKRIGVLSIVNEDPTDGPISSIRVALRFPGEWDAILIHPVDVAGVRAGDVSDLIESYRRDGDAFDAWVVSHQLKRGHPLLLRREKARRLLEKAGPPHLRALISSDDMRIQHVVSENALLLEDIDDPGDWERISPLLDN